MHYEERLWTNTSVTLEVLSLFFSALVYVFLPSMRSTTVGILLLTSAFAVFSPYKIVVTSRSFEVRDLVNLFGWRTPIERISKVAVFAAKNKVEVTYRYEDANRVKTIRSAKPEQLAKSIASATPHIRIDIV